MDDFRGRRRPPGGTSRRRLDRGRTGGAVASNHGPAGARHLTAACVADRSPRSARAANALGNHGTMLIPPARPAVLILDLLMALYFIVLSVSQIAMGLFAVAHVRLHQLRNTRRARALVVRMTSPPLVSVVAPAYNEQLTIEESVRAMLALDYESSEIVIVNDGSTDDTLAVLTAAFRLVPAPLAFAQPLRAAPVRGAY